MPFKSKAEARFMFAKHPKIAKEFASKTDFKGLPDKLGKQVSAIKSTMKDDKKSK
jgi:hypothetical protein